jgi:hypothetical protein
MKKSLLIRIVISILLFVVGWEIDNRTLAFIFFSIAFGILIYPLFLKPR